MELPEVKTKHITAIFSKWQAPIGSFLLVDKVDANLNRAARNVASVKISDVASFNVYDCLKARRVFITKAGLELLTARVSAKAEN
jgi:ribosomal protein L4